jgi:hypothetical protein
MILGTIEKQPAETDVCGIDFALRLGQGESLATPTVTAKNRETGVDTTSAVLLGAPTIAGTEVHQRYVAGLNGESHIVQFRVTTSAGNTKEDELVLSVKEW